MNSAVEATRSMFTREQWFSLPLPLRVKWWQETDYGQRMPSAELVSELASAHGQQAVKED